MPEEVLNRRHPVLALHHAKWSTLAARQYGSRGCAARRYRSRSVS
jgi:hypothetical protein